MAQDHSLELRHFTAPLDHSVAQDVIDLLQHKGAPWIADIRQRVRGELPGAEDHYFLAFRQGRMVAHVWYTQSQSDPRLGLIGHVFTRPDMRRQGLARQLLETALTEFRQRGGEIMQLFTSTPFSIPFYEQLGFENLFTQTAYHDQDWYMRYPAGASKQLETWFSMASLSETSLSEPVIGTDRARCRKLAPGDLPQYCLLYNMRHDMLLKDRAQQVGFGLESEMAFIETLAAMRQGRALCSVLDNHHTIVAAAALFGTVFPHQSHVGIFDIYAFGPASAHVAQLADHCLQHRAEVGIEKIYAMSVDAAKKQVLRQLGFQPRASLSDHYRIGQAGYDCELLEFVN